MKNRLVYLDNFKGIAALCVMLHHLLVAYLPVTFFGTNSGNYYDRLFLDWFSQTPISFIVNGNFWVFVFLMISGYIMFFQGSKLEDKNIFSSKILNRYIKLLIPVIPMCIIVFVLKNINNGIVFYNDEVGNEIYSWWLRTGYADAISLKDLLLSPFMIFFTGDGLFSNAFWMLDELLISSLAVFVIGFAFQNIERNKLFKYLLLCFSVLIFNKYYLPTFLGGLIYLLSSYDFKNKVKNNKFIFLLFVAILLFGIVAAGYPSGRTPSNFYIYLEKYRIFKAFLTAVEFWHILGAFIILLLLMNSEFLQPIFNFKCFNILGENSYSIYIIHIPIIYLLSPYLFKIFNNLTGKYFISSSLTILCICVVVILFSIYYSKLTLRFKDMFDKLIDKIDSYDFDKLLYKKCDLYVKKI